PCSVIHWAASRLVTGRPPRPRAKSSLSRRRKTRAVRSPGATSSSMATIVTGRGPGGAPGPGRCSRRDAREHVADDRIDHVAERIRSVAPDSVDPHVDALAEKAEEADDRPPGRYDRGAPSTTAPFVLSGSARRPQDRTGRRARLPPAERSTDVSDVVSTPLTITLDAEETTVTAGTTGTELFASRRDVVVIRVNGVLKDLDTPVADGD